MKTLLALTLALTTVGLNPAIAKSNSTAYRTIAQNNRIDLQHTRTNSQLQNKGRNKQSKRSIKLYVNTRLTPNGLFNRYLMLTGDGKAIWTRAISLYKLRQNITRRNVGVYRKRGSRIVIRWNDGKTWNLRAHRNGWTMGRGKPSLINTFYPPIPIKGRLRGQYVAQSTGRVGTTATPSSIGAYNKKTFVFNSNGRFQRSGFAGVNRRANNNSGEQIRRGTGISSSNGRGTYSLKEYSLVLRYLNGKRSYHTAFRLTGWKNALMIDGRMYIRRK